MTPLCLVAIQARMRLQADKSSTASSSKPSMSEGPQQLPDRPEGAIPNANGSGWLTPWKKGQSGNPSGVQGEYFRIRKLCSDNSMSSAKELIDLATSSKDDRVRYMAATWVIERGVGKVRDHSGDGESVMDLTKLSADERRTLAELMSRVLGVEGPK